ncbi:triose-phosphate transporter family-domain-containing protein [Phakopsora pachyrhizi]|uniref:Triose-phosphate transporter family-domain-containing protein n=1 Tax=Phakopsora pachyrhizi TaxID=170000 RepID=A0AAV0BAA4_PHAPC|nr:triose-phosphate transporter family-domain-containing protein [Phakopsora pachyrhizi]CAH7682672.1 triose-phosphate transporter family-domain-containing protein [Phakopsora pachyrhizi]
MSSDLDHQTSQTRDQILPLVEKLDHSVFDLDQEHQQASHQSFIQPNQTSLPSIQPNPSKRPSIHPAIIISIWISLSSSVIIFNKFILSDLAFSYPIWLTTWHLSFATIGTRILARSSNLLSGLSSVQMGWDRWVKSILPIGALFSASLIFNNMAYLTLSVSFIQMLKAFTSVAVLGMSVLMGLEKPNRRTGVIVLMISTGVAIASIGELEFALSGFIFQSLGIVFEALRLVSIQKLLHGMKMDPLVSLYYFAPVCAVLNAVLIPIYEGSEPFKKAMSQLGPLVLLSNASLAFALNVAVVFLIGSASSLVLTLSGVLKDVLLVGGSVLMLGSRVTFMQMVGYSIALVGLVVFKTNQELIDEKIRRIRTMFGKA